MGVPRAHEHARRHRALLAASAALLAPGAAEAASGDAVSLQWQVPASCPDQSAVLDRIRSLLATSAESAAAVTARGTVLEPQPGGAWELRLETVQGERTWRRTIHARSCDELADAAALIVAMVVDPKLNAPAPSEAFEVGAAPASSEARPTGPSPVPKAPPASEPAPPAAPQSRPVPPPEPMRRQGVAVHAAASVLGDVGSLPRAALGAEVAIGIDLERARLEAVGTLLPAVEKEIADDRPLGGEIGLLGAGLQGCYLLRWTRGLNGLCAGVEAGRLRGKGFGGSAYNTTEDELWLAGRLAAFASFAVAGPLSLRFGAEGVFPLRRPEFVLENVGPVHQPSAGSLRLTIGLEGLFR